MVRAASTGQGLGGRRLKGGKNGGPQLVSRSSALHASGKDVDHSAVELRVDRAALNELPIDVPVALLANLL